MGGSGPRREAAPIQCPLKQPRGTPSAWNSFASNWLHASRCFNHLQLWGGNPSSSASSGATSREKCFYPAKNLLREHLGRATLFTTWLIVRCRTCKTQPSPRVNDARANCLQQERQHGVELGGLELHREVSSSVSPDTRRRGESATPFPLWEKKAPRRP
jgi:hypothetical protein